MEIRAYHKYSQTLKRVSECQPAKKDADNGPKSVGISVGDTENLNTCIFYSICEHR